MRTSFYVQSLRSRLRTQYLKLHPYSGIEALVHLGLILWRPPSRVCPLSPTARFYTYCDVNTLNSLVLSLESDHISERPGVSLSYCGRG